VQGVEHDEISKCERSARLCGQYKMARSRSPHSATAVHCLLCQTTLARSLIFSMLPFRHATPCLFRSKGNYIYLLNDDRDLDICSRLFFNLFFA